MYGSCVREQRCSPFPALANGQVGRAGASRGATWTEDAAVKMADESEALPVPPACRAVSCFAKLDKLGEGTYGSVYRARDRASGAIVALKRIKLSSAGFDRDGMPLTSLREMGLLRRLRHPNVVVLQEVAVGTRLDSVFLVFELCEYELARVVDAMDRPFGPAEIKTIMAQLLRALAHLHANGVIHRDVKLSNLLITGRDHADGAGILKLCDFGLARTVADAGSAAGAPGCACEGAFTPKVVTLWYRAPEILLGSPVYGAPVDVWSAGCILGELLLGRPLMPGPSEPRQLELMCALLGTPSARIWPAFAELPAAAKLKLPDQPYNELPDRLAEVGPPAETLALLGAMLTYDPKARTTHLIRRMPAHARSAPRMARRGASLRRARPIACAPQVRTTAAAARSHEYFTRSPRPHTRLPEHALPPRRADAPAPAAAAGAAAGAANAARSVGGARPAQGRVRASVHLRDDLDGEVERAEIAPRSRKRRVGHGGVGAAPAAAAGESDADATAERWRIPSPTSVAASDQRQL